MRLSEAIEALCLATRVDGRTPRTVYSYQEKLSHLLAFLGDVPIEGITLNDLRRYVAFLRDARFSPFTILSPESDEAAFQLAGGGRRAGG